MEDTMIEITTRTVGDVDIIDVNGKMTLMDYGRIRDKIDKLLEEGRKKILINMEKVPYIDSSGLHELVRGYSLITRNGGRFKILHMTKRVTDLLAITKLLSVFEIFEDESEAIASFGK